MTDAPLSIDALDFLPVALRDEGAKRQVNVWRSLVLTLFFGGCASSALYQIVLERRARAELAEITPWQQLATEQNTMLARLQTELVDQRQAAELATYVRHPWPRSQVIAAACAGLSDKITLTRLQVVGESDRATSFALTQPGPNAAADKQPARAKDLKQLRAKTDRLRWVVAIAGTTSDLTALHAWLGELGQRPLFANVELGAINAAPPADKSGVRFNVRLILRPAYGMPGGPPVARLTGGGNAS